MRTPVLSEEIYIGNTLINLKKLNITTNNQTKKINPQEKKNFRKNAYITRKSIF